MKFTRESALERAKTDLAGRLGVDESEIGQTAITHRDFPDMSLGAAEKGEMAAQMISTGWQITLAARGRHYEYRGDKYQLRLHNFNGENFVID
jgi:hypothetical protein